MFRRGTSYALAALLVPVAAPPAHAAPTETGDDPYPGIYVGTITDATLPVRVHVVEVDLSSAEIHLRATAENERGQTTSAWAQEAGAVVAVNGDLFTPVGFVPQGLAYGGAGGGQNWGIASDTDAEGFVQFDASGGENHAQISPPEELVLSMDLPPETQGVVGGRPLLVRAGVAETSFDCNDAVTIACVRAPRTAVGVSHDGRTLYLVVVDGWQAGSIGWTDGELAQFMAKRGAWDALALDAGGSSVLYVKNQGGVVSSPSDGIERPVANQLGIQYGMLPPGTLVGFIRERDVFNGADLAGAKATLDTGQSMIVGANALYSFTGLAPRYTCVTASKTGYHKATSCKTVVSGQMEYNSIALFPNSDFIDGGPEPPDAAVPDAAGPTADASLANDAAPGADAANEPVQPAGCGCVAGGGPTAPGHAALGACALAGLLAMLRRKRTP